MHTAERSKSRLSVVLLALRGPKQDHRLDVMERTMLDSVIVPVSQVVLESLYRGSIPGMFGRKVDPQRVDFALAQSWLEDGDSATDSKHLHSRDWKHLDFNDKTRAIPFRMKAIDCFSRENVVMITGHKYLTSSYVWGNSQNSGSGMEYDEVRMNRVRDPASATTEDAMQVVRELGQRYLWIDRYCIPKSTSEHSQDKDK
jgi:hypothetical protein